MLPQSCCSTDRSQRSITQSSASKPRALPHNQELPLASFRLPSQRSSPRAGAQGRRWTPSSSPSWIPKHTAPAWLPRLAWKYRPECVRHILKPQCKQRKLLIKTKGFSTETLLSAQFRTVPAVGSTRSSFCRSWGWKQRGNLRNHSWDKISYELSLLIVKILKFKTSWSPLKIKSIHVFY